MTTTSTSPESNPGMNSFLARAPIESMVGLVNAAGLAHVEVNPVTDTVEVFDSSNKAHQLSESNVRTLAGFALEIEDQGVTDKLDRTQDEIFNLQVSSNMRTWINQGHSLLAWDALTPRQKLGLDNIPGSGGEAAKPVNYVNMRRKGGPTQERGFIKSLRAKAPHSKHSVAAVGVATTGRAFLPLIDHTFEGIRNIVLLPKVLAAEKAAREQEMSDMKSLAERREAAFQRDKSGAYELLSLKNQLRLESEAAQVLDIINSGGDPFKFGASQGKLFQLDSMPFSPQFVQWIKQTYYPVEYR